MATLMDLPLNDVSLVCRSCLAASGDMKNMTEWGYAEDFYKLTNIQINRLDNITELLCTSCEGLVLNYRSFVQQCRQSDRLLKDMRQKSLTPNTKKDVEENSIALEINENELTFKITAPDMESKLYLPCNQCHDTFVKKNDLISHMTKKHNNHDNIIINMKFFCSFPDCPYNVLSGKDKHFSGRKYLNQHIFKVHKAKNLLCHNCDLTFSSDQDFRRHLKTCNYIYICKVCDIQYKTNEKLLVHLLRKHPDLHKQYKIERKAEKRKIEIEEPKKLRAHNENPELTCDSPKRSFATQTFELKRQIKNDVTLPSWLADKQDETKKDEISTQTVFEDILSVKSQNSEDDLFFSETVSLSDIQTQTIPLEFGLSRSNKQTITSETQSPDLSMKETQTCLCLYETHKPNRCLEGIPSNSNSNFCTLTSTETQTHRFHSQDSDSLMSFTSTETQTCFDDLNKL
ncbi:hypothetical protein KGM_204915 [Danaus plexippus plexippus]|uniref:Uncharacterized protein n=1 Tax=Danaus plexippus plexippus TaxID=278856 RepID=A0A212EJC1_DANPL|nr:hypothetical protein KGM_204915 [Danaus plexippus plexippus]